MKEEARGRETWPNLVLVFTEAHQQLVDTDATVDELGFHSANAIVSQIFNQFHNEYTPPVYTPTHPELCMPITEAPLPIQAAESIPARRQHYSTSRPIHGHINDDHDGKHGIHEATH